MATWKKIITSGSAAELSSLTLDTALPVAQGGIGASSLADKAVLISQDSGTDAVGALALTTNGAIIVGGTNGPAVEAPADVAGTGLDAATGDGTLAINVAAAQTSITSIINSSLAKIGTNASQEYITFGTSNEVNTFVNNTERLSVTATGVDVTGHITASGDISSSGGFIGNLTGTADVATVATTVTITDNESTDEDNAVVFTAGGDVDGGNLGLESDGNLVYNPSTGRITATQLGGTLTTAAQGNVTSLGTLTTLTVDDITINASKISDAGALEIEAGGAFHLDGAGEILLDSATSQIRALGNITASGVISASGGFVGDGSNLTGISTDIDSLDALGGTGIAQGDKLIFSDAGTEKSITFSNLEDAIFGNVSGEATVAAGGALTIAANVIGNNELKQNDDITLQSLTTTNNVTIGGDLTVNGSTTSISTTNTEVADQFMFLASGSAASNLDAGIVVQSGSANNSGSAFYHDKSDERWSVAKGVAKSHTGAAQGPISFVTTVKTDTVNPGTTSGSYGAGEMHVNTSTGEIWIRFG